MLGCYGENRNFYTIKGEFETILNALRIKKAHYTADSTNPSFHPGRCAKVTIEGVEVGFIGQIHPLVAQNYDMDCDVYCAQINFTKLMELQLDPPKYTPLPKYPTVNRDLSFICDESVTVADAESVIENAAGKLLRNIRLFDIYRGKGIEAGQKSMAFSMELRADDRTLTDTDSEQVISKVLAALKEKVGATLR